VSISHLRVASFVIALSNVGPFTVPALEIVSNYFAACLEHLTNCATTFLRLTEATPKLVRHPKVIVPVMPSERFVTRWFAFFCHGVISQ
jgi:hypothetical protein